MKFSLSTEEETLVQTLAEASLHDHLIVSNRSGGKMDSISCVEDNSIRSSLQGSNNQLEGVSLSDKKHINDQIQPR